MTRARVQRAPGTRVNAGPGIPWSRVDSGPGPLVYRGTWDACVPRRPGPDPGYTGKPPTFWKGLPGPRGRPDPENRQFSKPRNFVLITSEITPGPRLLTIPEVPGFCWKSFGDNRSRVEAQHKGVRLEPEKYQGQAPLAARVITHESRAHPIPNSQRFIGWGGIIIQNSVL